MMKKKSIFLSGFLVLFIITVLLVFSNNKIIKSFYSAPHDEELTDISDNILEGSESKEEDFDTEYLSYIDTFIESEIDKGFPGAVLLVMKDGKVVKHTAYGYKLKYENGIELSNPIAMTEDTLFDLASNTKIYATTLAIIKLVDEGRIHLTDPVEKYLPLFKDKETDPIKMKKYVTIEHLLNHSSGLPANFKFYDPKSAKDFYSLDREKTIQYLMEIPLEYEPGTKDVYSDIGFMILGVIIEEVTGQSLDQYVEEKIYAPLGLKRTVFCPLKKGFKKEEIAATELNGNTRDFNIDFPNIRTYTLQGEVHDEKAYYSMGEVAGHAGLFSTAKELGILSQMILNGGKFGDYYLADEETIRTFMEPSAVTSFRTLGWNRASWEGQENKFGEYAGPDTIGHTGWTGTFTHIDPEKNIIVILLTNKKHSPVTYTDGGKIDGFKGDYFETGKYGKILTMVYNAYYKKHPEERPPVRLGIDRINQYQTLFQGKKIGLITNHTGMNSQGEVSIDVLYEKFNLIALFSPEHGIRGNQEAGTSVEHSIDEKTGLPIYSLYGQTKRPTEEMMKDIDILAFDMQDVGARFYTYISTMAYAMEACAQYDKTFVVFDRPNPIGGKVEGNCLDSSYWSFIGVYSIPQRHGMTVGELARLFNEEYGIGCKLVVIPMTRYSRDLYYEECGLNVWQPPSPNMPAVDTALVYSGTCIFEGTNISEGRGTDKPFEIIGAPWINGEVLADEMERLNLPGVQFRAITFVPAENKYKGQSCEGVELIITDRRQYNSVLTGLYLLNTIQKLYPEKIEYRNEHFDALTGEPLLRSGNYSVEEIEWQWIEEARDFAEMSKKYYLYQ